MKTKIRILSAFLLICPAVFYANRYTPLPPYMDGTMMPLEYVSEDQSLHIPDSLSPFHIEFLGRHGARYLSSEKKVMPMLSLLRRENAVGNLTATGRQFLELMEEVYANSKDYWGDLSAEGRREATWLGRRMALKYSGIFDNGNVSVNAISSDVPRVVNTMYCFTLAMRKASPNVSVTTYESRSTAPLMRFFETDPAYRVWLKNSQDWKTPYDEFAEMTAPEAPSIRLFKRKPEIREFRYTSESGKEVNVKLGKDGLSEWQDLSLMMYGMLQGLRAADLGTPTTQWMSVEEYRACWQCVNASQWLKRTATEFSQLPATAAVPLLIEIIEKADAALGQLDIHDMQPYNWEWAADWHPEEYQKLPSQYIPTPAANLRFGHAETLIPLASLMNLPGCQIVKPCNDATLSSECWSNSEVSPLGSNIEVVFAQAPSGTIYAAVNLNCRPQTFPGYNSPWIPWKELRAMWLGRMSEFS